MAVSATSTETHEGSGSTGFWALTLGSIGVVFGDIGTSPLYAFREAVASAAHGQPVTRGIVLGVLSLILWALFVVVTAKYVLLLLRADNNGEGGTLSLMALGQRALGRRSWPLLALGVIGASMFIGDSMITPAISVLSAVEGLKLATPAAEPYVVALTIFILVRPLAAFATAAPVIASQAVITGAYSLTRQAVQLGLLPRFEVRYTSEAHAGQIYLPRVNRLLLIGVLLLVLLFRTSSGLASAYGIAVSTTMVADGIMGFVVIWKLWNWRAATAAAVIIPFVGVDLTFFSANLLKLLEGAWVPLLFGLAMTIMIWTWRRGASILIMKTRRIEVPLKDLIKSLEKRPPHVVKGTAGFLTSDPNFVPTALLHNLKHNKVLHEHNVILTIETAQTPRVDPADRVRMETISDKFSTVRLRFGFMESPNVPKALVIARKLGWQFDIMATSFFVSRRSLKPSAQSGMPQWQDHLFIAMSRSANDATDYFQIPTGRVVAVGTPVTI